MKIFPGWIFASIVWCTIQTEAFAEWEVVPSPNLTAQANELYSVAAAGDKDVWAVGTGYDQQLGAYRTVTEHWDGVNWSIVPSPNASNGYNMLNGVAVVAPNDVWVVGQASNGNTYNTLIEHRTNLISAKRSGWSIVPSPNIAGSSNVLTAITALAPDNIWAVGYSTDSSFNNYSLSMHWNGSTWTIIPTPTVEGDFLFSVAAVASNDVWAVGKSRPIYSNARSLTLHWNGMVWTNVPSPNPSAYSNSLWGVAAIAANDVWAVGAAGSSQTLAIHWNGAAWTVAPPAPLGGNASNEALIGIVALSNNNIWTSGAFYQTGTEQTLTERWDGSNWTVVSSPNLPSSSNRIQGITVTPNGTLWAVGTTGPFGQPEQTLILLQRPEQSVQ
jgi:hypothetical protein